VQDVTVWVRFQKRRAPFGRFALLNLDFDFQLKELSGQEARALLLLLSNPQELSLKAIAQALAKPESCACRALKKLTEKKLAVKVSRGHYQCSPFLLHYGRWNVPSKQHLPVQPEKPETQIVQEDQEAHQAASQLGSL